MSVTGNEDHGRGNVSPTDDAPSGDVAIPTSLDAQLRLLDSLVATITASDPTRLHGAAAAEAQARVHAATERLSAQRLGWLGQVETDGLWALDAHRTFVGWVAASVNCSTRVAGQHVRAARMLRDTLVATARAARAGSVSTEHATVLTAMVATSPARIDALTSSVPDGHHHAVPEDHSPETGRPDHDDGVWRGTGEELLLELAGEHTMTAFTTLARRFAHVTDPESDERGFSRAQEREFVELSKTMDGYHLSGFLTDYHGRVLRTALDAFMAQSGRRSEGPTPSAVSTAPGGERPPAPKDESSLPEDLPQPAPLSRARLQAVALTTLARTV
ncbi:MAG: DUF222 domain-containing protein, partial [Cellulomonadaceae bacterium]